MVRSSGLAEALFEGLLTVKQIRVPELGNYMVLTESCTVSITTYKLLHIKFTSFSAAETYAETKPAKYL